MPANYIWLAHITALPDVFGGEQVICDLRIVESNHV